MFDRTSYDEFSNALNALRPGWAVSGKEIVGPEGAVLRLTQRHESQSLGHYDVQFVLDNATPEPVEIGLCGRIRTNGGRARSIRRTALEPNDCRNRARAQILARRVRGPLPRLGA